MLILGKSVCFTVQLGLGLTSTQLFVGATKGLYAMVSPIPNT